MFLKLIKYLKNILVIAVITILLLEISVAVYVHYKKLKIEIPTYSFQNTFAFWYDLNTDFGTLHLPNDTYRQKKVCYDVTYKSNSEGFRDVERNKQSKQNRVVVLGDSFIEGYGVSMEDRLTNFLENAVDKPHLNFGLAGNFGPTQYYILYKTLAKHYKHDAVLIGILPSNDFIDDDYEISKKYGGNRYKPFFEGDYPNLKVVYNLDTITQSKARPKKHSFKSKLLKNFSYTFALYNYIKAQQYIAKIPKETLLVNNQIPSYFNFTKRQLHNVRFAIEQIKAQANGKPVMIFTIPIYKEIKAYREHKKNPLGKAMQAFCDSTHVAYLDLLQKTNTLTLKECEELFLSCDGHWSPKGNAFAKQHILNTFNFYK